MARKTIREVVEEAVDQLRDMDRTALRDWAIAAGFDNRSAFPRFKKALKEAGIIDWEADRAAAIAEREEAIQADADRWTVSLISDAKQSTNRFAITDGNGNPVWHGRLFEEATTQPQAELLAAAKAIWLAGKVREAVGAVGIRLDLKVDAQWLTSLSGMAARLIYEAEKANVLLDISWIPGSRNPADRYTVCRGYLRWDENDLAALARSTEAEAA